MSKNHFQKKSWSRKAHYLSPGNKVMVEKPQKLLINTSKGGVLLLSVLSSNIGLSWIPRETEASKQNSRFVSSIRVSEKKVLQY